VDAAGQESARSNEIEMTPFNTMPLVAVDPTIGASTCFEDENAILGGFETTQIDGGMPYPRLEDVNAPNDSGITGYDGTAFINMAYSDQATVTWNNVSVSQAGNYAVSWRYSQAPGVFDLPDRPLGLMVNGQVITLAVSFPELDSWNSWAMNPAITVHLEVGVNSIELFADNTITPGANPHIDSMLITSTNAPVTMFPPPPTIGSALNTVQDPGFESVTAAQLETGTPSPWTFTAGPLLGSTMSAAGVAGNVDGYFTSGNPDAPQGTQVAFVQGADSSFSQSINFSAGTYSLTFQAAQRGVSGGETFNVLVDGQVVGSFTPGDTSYSTFTTDNFALSAGSHTIEFLGAGSAGGKETALIDNVRLNEVPGAPQDPSFETPSVGTGAYGAFQYQPGGSPWVFDAGSGVAGNGSGFTAGNPDAPDGTQVAFLQGYGSFSQSVTFAPGTYSISFLAAQRGNYQYSHQTIQVRVDGDVVGTFTPPDTNYSAYNTASFTVTAGAHTITFAGLDPDGGDKDNTAFIDQVLLFG
jgi:hypothetical protein